jgi:N-acylneuraminate cytidylyltransferase
MTKRDALKRLAFIPARGGSKRIPKKAIAEFHGRPILAWPIAAAQQSALFDLIHVSSDDPAIRSAAEACGADASLQRPAELADDHTGILPVARWALQQLDARGERFDDVFILFPAAPLLEARELVEAYDLYLAHGRTRNLLSVARAPTFPEWLFRRDADGRLAPLQPGGTFIRSQELSPAYYETGAFTIFSREYLLGDAPFDDSNYIGFEIPAWKAIDIDTPEDLEHARLLFPLLRDRA